MTLSPEDGCTEDLLLQGSSILRGGRVGDALVAVEERWEVACKQGGTLHPLAADGSGFPGLPRCLGAEVTAAACCPVLPGQGC